MAEPIMMLTDVWRTYEKAGGLAALAGVSLEFAPGEHVAITGPSGSGKSTLLHLLCGIDQPTRGAVHFGGARPRGAQQWAKVRGKSIGLVFQAFNLLPTLTAQENVEVPMFGFVTGSKARGQRADELLGRVGLKDRKGHWPNELSGGERQRLAIARALANRPEVILADEPTGNLDSKNAAEILTLLEELRQEHQVTLVVVTHESAVAARAQRNVRLLDGRVSQDERRRAN